MMAKITILGAGHIGMAVAKGLVKSNVYAPQDITLVRRNQQALKKEKQKHGFDIDTNAQCAISKSSIIIVALPRSQVQLVLTSLHDVLDVEKHIVISLVAGKSFEQLSSFLPLHIRLTRAMPNIAAKVNQSMTCIAGSDEQALQVTQDLFTLVGQVHKVTEELIDASTVMCASGLAFFMRMMRASAQGGVTIGFHANEATALAAQTAKGAVALLLNGEKEVTHPEQFIDEVTTPCGVTVTGLNEMEFNGLSLAIIKGIKAAKDHFA